MPNTDKFVGQSSLNIPVTKFSRSFKERRKYDGEK